MATSHNKRKDTMQNIDILGQLERLAASFPWDEVALWAAREPKGNIQFTAILQSNQQFGFAFDSASADCPEMAVERLIKDNPDRDPEKGKARKLHELQEEIAKLMSVEIGLPPYIPNRELAQYVNRTVDA